MDLKKYSKIYRIIESDNAEAFQYCLDDGFVIENEWADVEAFELALGVHSGNVDISKPLDQYEFKVADLFLAHGFDLKQHRTLLTSSIYSEFETWLDGSGREGPYREHPDGRASAYLLKRGVCTMYLLAQTKQIQVRGKGKTALDLAEHWDYGQHILLIPYLKKAGCKRSIELTDQERIYASYFTNVVELNNLQIVQSFLQYHSELIGQELDSAGISLLKNAISNLCLPYDAPESSLEWLKAFESVCERGLRVKQKGNFAYWFWFLVHDLQSVKPHPSHIKHDTDIQILESLRSHGVSVNQVYNKKAVLDLALEHGNDRVINYLQHHGAMRFETLKSEGQLEENNT